MARFNWKPEYSVGNAKIDEEHKKLFALVQEFENADSNDGLVSGLLGRLESYVEIHFAHEEQMMKEANYPEFDAHVKEHKIFVEWLKTVQKTYQRAAESPFEVGEMVNSFLENWLVKHILEQDMKYRSYLASES